MRFLLVDQILELDRGRRAVGVKNVAMTEDFLNHHFPGTPIMPGALIAEATLQLASWLIREASDFRSSGLPAYLERARFFDIVRPGDQLHLEVQVMDGPIDAGGASEDDEGEAAENRGEQMRFKSVVRCQGKRVASGRFVLDVVPTESLADRESIRRSYQTLTLRMAENENRAGTNQ